MAGDLQPLDQQFAIVDAQGRPTQYFTRWAQQRQIDITEAITLGQLGDYLAAHLLHAGNGIGLTPDGNLASGPTITAKVQEILDQISATRGTVLYRGAAGWAALAPGAAGLFLQTAGAGADPLWAAAGGGGGGGYGYEGFGDLLSLAGLTLIPGASANLTLTNGTKAHKYVWSASGANTIQGATKAAPATPWDLYCRFNVQSLLAANVQFGLLLRNSVSGKITLYAFNSNTNLSVQDWTNPTTFSSQNTVTVPALPRWWLRVNNDGTSLRFYQSPNGVDWDLFFTRTLAAFMVSIDQVGLGGIPQSAGVAWVSDFGHVVPA
jgi:hypothetical protein